MDANFTIKQIKDDEFEDYAFKIDVDKATIPPKSSYLIKVEYSPKIHSVVSVARF